MGILSLSFRLFSLYCTYMSTMMFEEDRLRETTVYQYQPKGLTGFMMNLVGTKDERIGQKIMISIAIFFFFATLYLILF
jgi:hypothetical protein